MREAGSLVDGRTIRNIEVLVSTGKMVELPAPIPMETVGDAVDAKFDEGLTHLKTAPAVVKKAPAKKAAAAKKTARPRATAVKKSSSAPIAVASDAETATDF